MALNTFRTFQVIKAEESTVPSPTDEASLMPYHVALIIDGIVGQVFHIEERLASLLLSNATIVQCDSPSNGGPDRDWAYDGATGIFSKN